MTFGWIEPEHLDGLDLSLPADPSSTSAVLAGVRSEAPAVVAVGLPEWRVPEWKGRLYPKGTKDGVLMDAYIDRYRCLEFNGTHYRIYAPEEVRRWAGKAAGHEFQFLPKFPQTISHQHRFVNAEADTEAFLEGVRAFGPHLGPLFLQVSEWYDPSPAHQRALYAYLATLPGDLDYFVELRHPQWFEGPARAEWTTAFRDLDIGAVITDTPGRRDAVHMELTVPRTFVRFVGKARHATTYRRLDDWALRLQRWLDAGLQECRFLVHAGRSSPEASVDAIARINKTCGLQLPVPPVATSAPELF